jgi:IS5 family transposase
MTSISWVICFMERSNLSQPMPATKERHSARSWPVDVDWLIAERPGRENLEAASAQEQNGHQHRIHESQHPCQGGAPVSHHQAAVRLRESQIQGLLKNDNQLAMLFTLANLFRVDQMIRQWERSQ